MTEPGAEVGVFERYFRTSIWIDKATEVGCLAIDNYDPTYGNGGVSCGPQVYECLVCGAVVFNAGTHVRWHEGER